MPQWLPVSLSQWQKNLPRSAWLDIPTTSLPLLLAASWAHQTRSHLRAFALAVPFIGTLFPQTWAWLAFSVPQGFSPMPLSQWGLPRLFSHWDPCNILFPSPLLIVSPYHISPPYIIYAFLIYRVSVSSSPLLECKLHPSSNLFVYFCIPRIKPGVSKALNKYLLKESKIKQINRRCSINIR